MVIFAACGNPPPVPSAPPPAAGGIGLSEARFHQLFPESAYEYTSTTECGRPCLNVTFKGAASAVIKGYGPVGGFNEVSITVETKPDTAADAQKVMDTALGGLTPEVASWVRSVMPTYNYKRADMVEKTIGSLSVIFTGSEIGPARTHNIFVRSEGG